VADSQQSFDRLILRIKVGRVLEDLRIIAFGRPTLVDDKVCRRLRKAAG